MLLGKEFEADQIGRRPASLCLDDRFQRFDGERVAHPVRGDCYTPAVGVGVALMRPDLADEFKTVVFEGGDQLPGGD